MRMLSAALTLMLGCSDKEEEDVFFPSNNGPSDETDDAEDTDADGDGYSAEEDCDDADAAINPGAEEVCDFADNDCDGEIDEDVLSTFYTDADGDGYGDEMVPEITCELKSGYADNSDDCDDTSAEISPAADEVCDGLDNDCDGTLDESTAIDASSWYYDGDGDGYGDDAITIEACELQDGYAQSGGDCDDDDAAYNPGAEEFCDDPSDYNCDGSVGYADDDSDGYAACNDCDDGDGSINPDADERCDGLDNDCDGDTDEDDAVDAATWYADGDGDGFGDVDTTAIACDAPSGFTADTTDCDDSNGSINPDADELCDEDDNDCDGETDEDDAADAATWYSDGDSDGFGDVDSAVVQCTQPSGHVADASDCEDGDGSINPDADEVCDGVDNDCDDAIDDYDDSLTDASTWYRDLDEDGYGFAAYAIDSCDQPSNYVEDDTDCDDDDSAAYPGNTEVCDEVDNDCDGDTDEDAADQQDWYADTDGDGFGDAANIESACAQSSGYVSDDTDCDDTNFDVNTDATEVCDEVDNDCDGETDEADAADAATLYADTDGDGFGDADSTTTSCGEADGYVINDTDCDDDSGDAYPGNTERCDGVDNDCDGDTDEADAADAPTWHADGDTDGFGDASIAVTRCDQPSGYVEDDADCNDANIAINPDAVEVCDTLDNDCNGDVDDDDAGLDTTTAVTWFADGDSDGFGDVDSPILACIQPSSTVTDATDCDDGDGSINPDGLEICNTIDDDCDGDIDDDDSSLDTSTGTTFYVDGDGDGFGDAASPSESCVPLSGTVADDSDCDDGDGSVYPGASGETFHDGVDQDCDGFDGYTVADLNAGDLIITEIMVDPAQVSDSEGEYFEIYNNFGSDIDLDGLGFADNSSSDSVDETLVLSAGDRTVFGRNGDVTANGGVELDFEWSGPALSNAGDSLTLSFDGTTIDAVDFTSFTIASGAALSLDTAADAVDNDDASFWCNATSTYGDGDRGTPGAANDVCGSATYTVGFDTEFSGSSSHAADELLGQKITVGSDATLTGFGIIAKNDNGASVTVALYEDSSGSPGSLVAQSSSTALATGDNQISLGLDVSIVAGDYWFMAVYDDTCSIAEDTAASIGTLYISQTYGSSLPDPYSSSHSSYLDGRFNYYLLVY